MADNEKIIKFYGIYGSEVLPQLRQFEEKRKKEKKKVFAVGIFASVLFLGILLYSLFNIFHYKSANVNQVFLTTTVRKTVSQNPVKNGGFVPNLLICLGSLVLIPAVFVWYAKDKEKSFRIELKVKCSKMIAQAIGDIEWDSSTGFAQIDDYDKSYVFGNGVLLDSGLFPMFNVRYVDDEFKGTYKDVLFRICETSLFLKNKGLLSCAKVFNGVVITFAANKKIKEKTFITSKHDFDNGIFWWIRTLIVTALFFIPIPFCFRALWQCLEQQPFAPNGWLYPIVSLILILLYCFVRLIWRFYCEYDDMRYLNDKQFQKVELEDTKFAKRFCVYSSDQIESRYLVTTAFMERLLNIKTAFGAKHLKCSFFDGQIMIAISTNKDLFEIGSLYKSLEDTESVNTFFNEIYSILSLIDYFKLDESTGL